MQIITLFILIFAHDASATARIELTRTHSHSKPLVIELTQDKKGSFQCKTNSVRLHRVEIEGLSSEDAPFKKAEIEKGCEKTVSWSGVKRCYQRHQSEVLDRLIRWCNQI